ncbi:MAG: DinB family protein [Pirellulaceae bacterium]
MNAVEALRLTIDMGEFVGTSYLKDLTDEELMDRPHPGCNHVNWQVGHLIVSEHRMIEGILPGSMPALPAGFAARYTKESATSDRASDFATKEELLSTFQKQRAATLAALSKLSDSDLNKPTGVEYAPTVGSMFALQGSHWLMHCGQWVITRRKFGRPPLF